MGRDYIYIYLKTTALVCTNSYNNLRLHLEKKYKLLFHHVVFTFCVKATTTTVVTKTTAPKKQTDTQLIVQKKNTPLCWLISFLH